jgi:hypothetical protein
MHRLIVSLALAAATAAGLRAFPAQSPALLAIDDVRPGMVGTGRTVFAGEQIEEFRAHVIGVLRNVMGPQRDLILARLEGGPLAQTGVIQGMSGSPVYIDGKLVGAVSYQLGSFPREPIAGITPIAEMLEAVSSTAPRSADRSLTLDWPATADQVYAALGRLAARAAAPLGVLPHETRVVGPSSIADLAPALRPIGAAMVVSGFDASIDRRLRGALAAGGGGSSQASGRNGAPETPLRPGDPVGMSLIRGDFEMGATGTVTHIDGSRVFAFGHPFLNLGPTQFAMTRAHVYTVLPSLDSSMKIATMGPVIGTMTQDRSTAVGGTLGAAPRELHVNLTLSSDRAPDRRLEFFVLHDQMLTPLFTYVAVLNSLVAYERQSGALSVAASGTVSFGKDGTVTIDDLLAGETAITATAAAVTAAIGAAATNEFRPAMPERFDLRLRVSERNLSSTIERVWLDTNAPKPGSTHQVQVQLRHYRGDTETISIPVQMPSQASGPLTLLVSDAATLTQLEQRELKPGRPSNWPALLDQMNSTRRNNRLYVRLISASAGTVVAGETLPALPSSVRSILDDDKTTAVAPVAKTAIGAWEHKTDRAIRGSRELSISLAVR